MIYVGVDDTDTLETRGTNQLARALESQDGCTAIECNPMMTVGTELLAVDAVLEFGGGAMIDGTRDQYEPGAS